MTPLKLILLFGGMAISGTGYLLLNAPVATTLPLPATMTPQVVVIALLNAPQNPYRNIEPVAVHLDFARNRAVVIP
jgi:hypothetical protein